MNERRSSGETAGVPHAGAVDELRQLQEAGEWLIRLQESRDEADLADWLVWCERDPAHLEAFERLLPLWQALEPRASARTAIVGAGPPPGRMRRMAVRSLAMAAGMALVLAGGWHVWGLLSDHAGSAANLSSPVAQHREVTLQDGSALELGARSEVVVSFKASRRDIEMSEGQAYFNVRPDKRRPFVVRTGDLRIIAVGTAFDVLRTGTQVVVTVEEGAVDVVSRGAAAGTRNRVPAGYQLVHDHSRGDRPLLRKIDPQSALAWRKGRLEFHGDPLSAVVDNVNRYTARPVILHGETLGMLRYTGTIEVRSLEEWVHALPTIFDVRVVAKADGVHILPKDDG